ncbi:hydrogenase nickel incorporation protein HypB [bacterium]|nr:hydrogenase nickel incorporation protein HypB [bacterium]
MNERIPVEKKILSENDRLAAEIRSALQQRRIPALNLVSSPGSGKTSLLEVTLKALDRRFSIGLIAGDVQTENDAQRLRAAGGAQVQAIVTNGACHLDARMVGRALAGMNLDQMDLLVIENVGNLVCPSSYDLGEDMKIVLISTTEGDDKPLKYPAMFRRAAMMIVNKTDLLGLSDFSLEQVEKNAQSINPELQILSLSCRTGSGVDGWLTWLTDLILERRQPSAE